MASPSRASNTRKWRAFVCTLTLVGALLAGAIAPTGLLATPTALAETGYLGYDTVKFYPGELVEIRTDDGGGLNIRSGPSVNEDAVVSLRDGTVVEIVDGPFYDTSGNGWYLVTDGSSSGYAFAGFFVSTGSGTATAESVETENSSSVSSSGYLGYDTPQYYSGEIVAIATDDGGGLWLRSGPSTGNSTVTAVRDGATVTIVDGPFYDTSSNGWYLVTDGGTEAYAFAGFLASTGASATSSSSSTTSASTTSTSSSSTGYLGYDTPQFYAGDLVEVATDDGGGLWLRSQPNTGSDSVVAVRDGSVLEIVDGPFYDSSSNGWYEITDGSIQAFAFAGFLSSTGSSNAPASTASSSSSPSSSSSSSSGYLGYDTPQFYAGDSVIIATDDGGGLWTREDANTGASTVAALRDGTVVTIVDGPYYDSFSNGWYLISDGGISAFAFAGFLELSASASSSSSSSTSASTSSARFSIGEFAEPDGGVNVRNGASVGSPQTGTLSPGDVVEILDGPYFDSDGDDWYYVSGGGAEGFAMGAFLLLTSAPAQEPAPSEPAASGSAFIYPLASYSFTQEFGCSPYNFYPIDPNLGCRFHSGIDLAAPSYTPIVASAAGTVVAAQWCDCGLGYYVEIDHGGGITSLYGHMAELPYVSVGQFVSQGETIGPVGSTGLSTGPHVHFMIEVNGSAVDPLGYL